MNEDSSAAAAETLALTTKIVAAFVGNNALGTGGLKDLIGQVHATLLSLGQPVAAPTEELVPAVPIKKSITADYIVCLDDGKKFKSMKRHLAGLGMTPGEYRTKWGLPSDYPMVAPDYAARRSAMAISNGLGRKAAAKAPAKHAGAANKG